MIRISSLVSFGALIGSPMRVLISTTHVVFVSSRQRRDPRNRQNSSQLVDTAVRIYPTTEFVEVYMTTRAAIPVPGHLADRPHRLHGRRHCRPGRTGARLVRSHTERERPRRSECADRCRATFRSGPARRSRPGDWPHQREPFVGEQLKALPSGSAVSKPRRPSCRTATSSPSATRRATSL